MAAGTSHLAARARLRLRRRPSRTRPSHLADIAALCWRPARRREIPLAAIVGTVEATADFDAQLRPATDRVSLRWQRVARAFRAGHPLPPITVVERPDGYYIVDGRHRVSVARELGHRAIDAWTSRCLTQISR
jgi:ParB-like nuclease family protein